MAEVFQMFGKRPSLREMLNSLEREGVIVLAMPFNILPDKPSGPLALPGSRDVMYESISLGVQRRFSGHKLSCDNTSLFSGGSYSCVKAR